MRLSIFDKCDWAKSKVFIHEGLHNWVSLGQGNMHLNGALAVPNVMSLLFCYAVHVGEEGREVVVSHMLESEFPKLFVFVGVVFGMVSRVLVTSAVSQPNIIAFIGEHESWGLVLVVDEPGV